MNFVSVHLAKFWFPPPPFPFLPLNLSPSHWLPLFIPSFSSLLYSFSQYTVSLLSVPNLNSDLFDLQPAFIPAVQSTPSISNANSAWGGTFFYTLQHLHIYGGNSRGTHMIIMCVTNQFMSKLNISPSDQLSHLLSHSIILLCKPFSHPPLFPASWPRCCLL